MPTPTIKDLRQVDSTTFDYIYEQNVTIQLPDDSGLVRCNVYRPKAEDTAKFPVLVTYGPYGKDIPYETFHPDSFSELNPEHKSPHSAWETPDPAFWTKNGYIIVRADERGLGQSPGPLDTMSRSTSEGFANVVEWAARQVWSTGKVGLLGVSYYAGSQWRVAARQPKGLACIIPWEGMSDYYRDRCRHGGILSNTFIDFWWNRQVVKNQYGVMGTIEGEIPEEERASNRRDQRLDNAVHRYRDEDYYASREYSMSDIEVPILSVANWGGILLHLRGNVMGYLNAGSKLKYLRFITGRHDLPFYYKESVELQMSFLDAFLKGDDRAGWITGTAPKVALALRKGNAGVNNYEAEKAAFPYRTEDAWPISRTAYMKYFLTPNKELVTEESMSSHPTKLSYKALGNLRNPHLLQFTSPPMHAEVEFTGHIVARLNVSVSALPTSPTSPRDLDLFLTLRHLSPDGSEILYTGTVGDPVPLTKGWLRVSLRKVAKGSPQHQDWLPHRTYLSTDVRPIIPGEIYTVDVEMWPTNVVIQKGGQLVLEVSSGDTQGAGLFEHNLPEDRPESIFQGDNHIHLGAGYKNWVLMPMIPQESNNSG